MAPHDKVDAVVIIFDVGKSVSRKQSNGKPFFENSRECISWILRRKIMSYSKDLISLVLTGTDEDGDPSNDSLASNICVKYDFQLPSWNMLYYIDNLVDTSDEVSDWLGALAVALQKFDVLDESNNISSKSVVIFSDLTYTSSRNVSSVLSHIKSMNVEVTFIGSDCIPKIPALGDQEGPLEKRRRLEEEISVLQEEEKLDCGKIICIMWNLIGDLMRLCPFDSALKQLSSYSKRVVRAHPWNCLLDIGDFKISVQMFKKVDTKVSTRYKLKAVKPGCSFNNDADGRLPKSLTDVVTDKIMYYSHKNENDLNCTEVSVQKDEIIAGFRYGGSLIPFSDEDKSVMGFKPGDKCFSVLGFTAMENVPYYILTGEGSYVVVPREKDEKAEIALSAIIQALFETNTVAVVRRVYSDNRGLSLGVLYPVVENFGDTALDHKECLIFIELAFEEDVKNIQLPRLRRIKQKINREQFSLIDDLIDGMNLMKPDGSRTSEECELLDCSSRHEVQNQFFQHCIVHKALYPSEPLPDKLPNRFRRYIAEHEFVMDKSDSFKNRLMELFPKKLKEKIDSETFGAVKSDEKDASLYTFGNKEERTPNSCFRKLFGLQQYPKQEDISNLLRLSVEEFNFQVDEIVETFLHFTAVARREALQKYTDDYNYWLRRLRINLGIDGELERKYWKGVLEDKLGLITTEEHGDSSLKMEEAEFFTSSLSPQLEESAEETKRKVQEEEEEAINMLF